MMTTDEWITLISKEFDVDQAMAKAMLHAMREVNKQKRLGFCLWKEKNKKKRKKKGE